MQLAYEREYVRKNMQTWSSYYNNFLTKILITYSYYNTYVQVKPFFKIQ